MGAAPLSVLQNREKHFKQSKMFNCAIGATWDRTEPLYRSNLDIIYMSQRLYIHQASVQISAYQLYIDWLLIWRKLACLLAHLQLLIRICCLWLTDRSPINIISPGECERRREMLSSPSTRLLGPGAAAAAAAGTVGRATDLYGRPTDLNDTDKVGDPRTTDTTDNTITADTQVRTTLNLQ